MTSLLMSLTKYFLLLIKFLGFAIVKNETMFSVIIARRNRGTCKEPKTLVFSKINILFSNISHFRSEKLVPRPYFGLLLFFYV